MNGERREATLRATAQAARVRARVRPSPRQSFDIVGLITDLGIPLVFRRTEKLLGLAITIEPGLDGILVTTSRGLAVQRFTAAHELGHLLLGHDVVLDLDTWVLGESDWSAQSVEEYSAEVFASELLASRDRIYDLAVARGWSLSELQSPAVIYQAALRLGISFKAGCWAMARANLLSGSAAARVAAKTVVADLKRSLVSGGMITDPWSDVWDIRLSDTGTVLEAGPNDLFRASLSEDSSAGFLWDPDASFDGFDVVESHTDSSKTIGGQSTRVIILRAKERGLHEILLDEIRPWSGERASRFDLQVDNYGKEEGGLPSRVRRAMLAEGAPP